MIVLFFMLLIVILIITMGVKINLIYFNINDVEKLNLIIDMLLIGDNKRALEYTNYKIRVKLCLFGIIPIFNKTISNKNLKINNNKKGKYKDKIKDKVMTNIEITNMNYNIIIGSNNTILTSTLVSIVSILISSFLPYFIDINKNRNIRYKVIPKYNKDTFYMNLALKLKIPIYKIL